VNLDFLALAERDPGFRDTLNRVNLACVDGHGVRWLARVAGLLIPERVAGSDLTTWLLEGGIPEARIFLLGSTPDVLTEVSRRAAANGVAVAGCASPPRDVVVSPQRSAALVDEVNQAAPDIVLVALGAPLQEEWIARHRADLDVAVAMGVGASLDFLAGAVTRAPVAIQRIGLEWLYRLAGDPARLWGRYVRRDIPYFVREAFRSRKPSDRSRRSSDRAADGRGRRADPDRAEA
jgi:N-acetylglucosaminyldiphosphoundecaprenol N-acetyl-beta-D-mannosaminyltransferase